MFAIFNENVDEGDDWTDTQSAAMTGLDPHEPLKMLALLTHQVSQAVVACAYYLVCACVYCCVCVYVCMRIM